jgi:hypothetical protein
MLRTLENLLFPTSLHVALVTAIFAASISFYSINNTNSDVFSSSIYSAAISLAGVVILSIIQKILLRSLFSYHDWLFERGTNISTKTKIWNFLLRKCFNLAHRETLAFQNYLPQLQVPELKDTIERYSLSMEPLLSSSEMESLRKRANEFLKSDEADICQRQLISKYYNSTNYVSDWWLEHAYLKGRDSLMINSNYAAMTLDMKPLTPRNTSRAAFYVHRFLQMVHDVAEGKVEPQLINNAVPLCMNQYQKILSLTRLPGILKDKLIHYSEDETGDIGKRPSHHVVVIRHGQYFKIDVYARATNQPKNSYKLVPPSFIEASFDQAIREADENKDNVSEAEKNLSALTGWNRTSWARVREEKFLKNDINAYSLGEIESAIMVISFDDIELDWEDLSEVELSTMCGGKDGRLNRWYDKSVTMCVSNNAVLNFNCEHSFADGPAVGHFLDEIMASEVQDRPYELPSGRVTARIGAHPATIIGGLPKPQRLQFDLDSTLLVNSIREAAADVQKAANDLDLCASRFTKFGKKVISHKCKVSPDAFVQAALQVAYYRNQNSQFCPTYESAMARLFLDGRTETIRSCTNQMVAFVKAFVDDSPSWKQNNDARAKVVKLLRSACENHQTLSSLAMVSKAPDRHLFALYIASFGVSSGGNGNAFLRETFRPWKLSTSQVPCGQSTKWKDPDHLQKYPRANGGFGPVANNGYGVSYVFAGNHRIVVHVTCKKSCPTTDAKKFQAEIAKAFEEMMELFS